MALNALFFGINLSEIQECLSNKHSAAVLAKSVQSFAQKLFILSHFAFVNKHFSSVWWMFANVKKKKRNMYKCFAFVSLKSFVCGLKGFTLHLLEIWWFRSSMTIKDID